MKIASALVLLLSMWVLPVFVEPVFSEPVLKDQDYVIEKFVSGIENSPTTMALVV